MVLITVTSKYYKTTVFKSLYFKERFRIASFAIKTVTIFIRSVDDRQKHIEKDAKLHIRVDGTFKQSEHFVAHLQHSTFLDPKRTL